MDVLGIVDSWSWGDNSFMLLAHVDTPCVMVYIHYHCNQWNSDVLQHDAFK